MAVILLVVLSSCASLGSNTFTSENRRAGLAEALSTDTEADKKKDLALELPFADAVRTTPSSAEPVPVQSAEKEEVPVTEEEIVVPEEKEPVTTSVETVKEEPAPAVEEAATVPEPAPVTEEKEAVQEVIKNTAPQKEDVPVAGEKSSSPQIVPGSTVFYSDLLSGKTTTELPPVTTPSDAGRAEKAESSQALPPVTTPSDAGRAEKAESRQALPPAMSRVIVESMIASVVIVIMFTVATAIRSAYRMPLSYLLSVVITLLITFLPFLISVIAGGMSPVWFSYLILLFSFFIFRSGKGRRFSR